MRELIAIRTVLEIYLASKNISHCDVIIQLSDCRSVPQAIQGGKKRLIREINILCFPLSQLKNSAPFSGSFFVIILRGNGWYDYLVNESRTIDPVALSTTVFDTNAVAKYKLSASPLREFSVSELNYSREITTIIATLRTKLFKGMKILPDSSRIYVEGKHCSGT